jgi:DNA-binding transcriptional ArsR family regulator
VIDSFDALAERARRDILERLVPGPLAVGEISSATGLSQPNTSRHLRILREAGLVDSRAEGQRRLYGLRSDGFTELIRWLAPYARMWQDRLNALERHFDSEA